MKSDFFDFGYGSSPIGVGQLVKYFSHVCNFVEGSLKMFYLGNCSLGNMNNFYLFRNRESWKQYT